MTNPAGSVTAGRVRADLVDLERECSVIAASLGVLDQTSEAALREGLLKGLALDLHALYTGLEHIFELIARQIDEVTPAGERWHRELLQQMAAANPGVRPAVISRGTEALLDELLRFRHVIRSVYSYEVDSARVLEIAIIAPRVCERLSAELGAFADALERGAADS